SAPEESTPVESAPAESVPEVPSSNEPVTAEPVSTDTGSVEPVSVESAPTESASAEPASGEPAPAGAASAESASSEPAPEEASAVPAIQGSGSGSAIQGPPDSGSGEPPAEGGSRRVAFWIAVLALLAILAGAYAYGCRYCEEHFMPGTQVNNVDFSGLTVREAEELFSAEAENYVLNIRFRGGATEMLRAKELGFEYSPDGSIDALLQGQDKYLWPKYFFEESVYTVPLYGTTDPDLVMNALKALPELRTENMEEPRDAYIMFRNGNDKEDGRFEIIPDTEGSVIDAVQLAAAVTDAAARYEEMVDAEAAAGVYVPARVTKDSPKLISRCQDLNDRVGASITYELPDGGTIKLNSDVMKDWLVRDSNGKLKKDDDVWDEKLWEFLQMLADNANTLGMNRRFHSSLRGTITVSGGDYGYMVNQIVEHDLLLEDLPAGKKETRKPSYYLTPYNEETENDGIGTSYIEVDLSAQHIWCYVDGELKMDCDCVSGNTSDGHNTPTGVFGIMFMKKDATLRGVMQSNGKYEYETKVGYWMPFYAECGFHDAWWRTAFGGSIYTYDGSHGCINLPVEGAEELFSYCDEKMPVVVYGE
ncbi:MAG: L,D-transpeptidase, partial [Eubacteriales bacterium]|nr:L,D-transpeptidase [Eubacteriales bacterium]